MAGAAVGPWVAPLKIPVPTDSRVRQHILRTGLSAVQVAPSDSSVRFIVSDEHTLMTTPSLCIQYFRTNIEMNNNRVKHYLIILIIILFFLIKIRKIVDKI